MGHVVDRWTRPGPSGKRVRTDRWGKGKRWLARWSTPDGRERSRACASKDEALAFLARVDTEIRGGTYVLAESTTFEQYARQWLESQLQQRPQTTREARGKLERYAFPVIGHLPISKVTRSDVQRVVNDATSLGPAARRVMYAWVRAVFNSAVEDRLVAVSPCRRVNLPELTPGRVRPLTPEQVALIASRMPPHMEAMVWLGAGSGLRPGELRSLTVDRVQGGRLVVDRQLSAESRANRPVFGPLKTAASERVVSLAPVTVAVLERHVEAFPPGPAGLVFTSARRGVLNRSLLGEAWRRATRGLGLGDRSGWHALRHHHASLLIAAGASPRAVADRLGHADPTETLRTYAHLWASDEDRMLEAVQGAYGPRVVRSVGHPG